MSSVPVLAIVVGLIYIMVRLALLIFAQYHWYEDALGIFLLLAEGFILLHGVGYFLQLFRIVSRGGSYASQHREVPELTTNPPVAIVVPAYKEDIEILRETLATLTTLNYPDIQPFLLDDTPYDDPQKSANLDPGYKDSLTQLCQEFDVNLFRHKWRNAKAGIINDFCEYLAGNPRAGSRLDYTAASEMPDNFKYLAVFDADMQPVPEFATPLVAKMEADDKLAFVQTPQYYTNFEDNRVARAAGLQQSVFYEYICEGKSKSGAMFCCGTNIMFRLKALRDIGGMDEGSITEDFATGVNFHSSGWESEYYSTVLAFGTGPEDLAGYFKQQFRWAYGTISTSKKVIKKLFTEPTSMSPWRWWEYILSSTYYWVGLVFTVLVICPMLYLFMDVPSYFIHPEIYLLVFLPYITITLGIFFITLKQRQYSVLDILSGQLLIAITFPVYTKAAVSALLGRDTGFVVTPKGAAGVFPLRDSWPQLLLMTLSFAAVVWGGHRLYYQSESFGPLAATMFWCVYHFVLLVSLFYFRRPVKNGEAI